MAGLHFWEPEETIGALWHRFVVGLEEEPRFPEAAIALEDERRSLGVLFRGLGGAGGVEMRATEKLASRHRLSFRRRLGADSESVDAASFDGLVLSLPASLDVYAQASLNADLYRWLTALSAFAHDEPARARDPLQADALILRHALQVQARVLAHCPGLRPLHLRLQAGELTRRRRRTLPPQEAAIEAAIRHALGDDTPPGELSLRLLDTTDPLNDLEAGLDYRPMRPVLLWPLRAPLPRPRANSEAREDDAGSGTAQNAEQRKKAKRAKSDQANRKDSLILHRFESILSLADFLNLNRKVEDDDESGAKKAAEDLDKLSLAKADKSVATRLKFDLDLAPEDADLAALSGVHLLPEWDWRTGIYHRDYCQVLTSDADIDPAGLQMSAAARRRIAAVRRSFEALRPKRAVHSRQMDGNELDLDAVVRARVDLVATGEGSDRIWRTARNEQRDLSVAILLDTSRSTEASCAGRAVITVAKEALLALVEGIDACGDDTAVYSFSSLRRQKVFVRRCKDFGERIGPDVRGRIAGLKPGFYTRIGAAIRHTTKELAARPTSRRLLLIITDGKPNDLDHYDGRYGIEDTRKAVQEARRKGMSVFGITVDAKAHDYVPHIFGQNGYAIVPRPEQLITALPGIWRSLMD